MNTTTPLFLKQCQAIITTMQEVITKENELHMGSWVSYVPPKNECDFVACVMGHLAVSDNLEHFDLNFRGQYDEDKIDYLSYKANALADVLCEHNDKQIGELGHSILMGHVSDRKLAAQATKLFNQEELITLAHLNLQNPTPQQVIKYVEMVIEKAATYYEDKESDHV
jgi:hypothetical protein